MHPRAVAIAFLALLATSCADDWEQHTVTGGGYFCIEGPGSTEVLGFCNEVSLKSGMPILVNVRFDVCIGSAGCSRVDEATCRVVRDGSSITISATGKWSDNHDAEECSGVCGAFEALCETGPLPGGTYDIRYSDTSLAVTVPSTTAKTCSRNSADIECCDNPGDCNSGVCGESNWCRPY